MSKKQLETLFAKAEADKNLFGQIEDCGLNNSCLVAIGMKYGHKFSPATVSHWHRDNGT